MREEDYQQARMEHEQIPDEEQMMMQQEMMQQQ